MSKAHICDRCGSVYSTSETGASIGVLDGNVPTTIRTWPTGDKEWGKKRELCSKCSEKLRRFIGGQELDERNEVDD